MMFQGKENFFVEAFKVKTSSLSVKGKLQNMEQLQLLFPLAREGQLPCPELVRAAGARAACPGPSSADTPQGPGQALGTLAGKTGGLQAQSSPQPGAGRLGGLQALLVCASLLRCDCKCLSSFLSEPAFTTCSSSSLPPTPVAHLLPHLEFPEAFSPSPLSAYFFLRLVFPPALR